VVSARAETDRSPFTTEYAEDAEEKRV